LVKRNRHLGIVTVGRGRASVQLGAASGFLLAPPVGVVKVAAVLGNFGADGESTRRRTQRSFPRHSTKRAFGVVSPLKAVSYSWSGRTLEIARVESSLLLIRFWVSPSSRSNVSGFMPCGSPSSLGFEVVLLRGGPALDTRNRISTLPTVRTKIACGAPHLYLRVATMTLRVLRDVLWLENLTQYLRRHKRWRALGADRTVLAGGAVT
jgi:hypothetical protein